MTAKRADMAAPDNLLFLDSDAVNSSLTSAAMEQDEPTHAPDNQTVDSFSSMPDQHTNPASESSGLMPAQCQYGTRETHSQTIQTKSNLVLTQPTDPTGLTEMTINHPHDEKTDNSAVMENDDILKSNPDLIYIPDSGMERNQNDKQTDLNHPNANMSLMSPEVSLLKEEMSQYASSEITGQENSQMANDDNALAINETDKTTSESLIQTCWDTPEGVDGTLESAATYKTDIVNDVTCGSFTNSQPLKIEDLKTDVSLCLAGLPETDPLNILTPASTVLETLGKNDIFETADLPVNDTEMIRSVNLVQNLGSEHDEKDPESNRTDTTLDKYATSESGQEVRQVANDDDALVNSVSDVINSEKSPDQPFSIANNEPDAASSESSIQTCRDTPGSVAALEVVTTYRNHQEMHDLVKDATCGSFSSSDPLKIEDLKTDVSVCLAGLPETAPLNILTPASTALETLGKNDIFEIADLPVNDTEMVQPVNPVQNLVSEHDGKDPESNRTDTTLDKYATSESGQEVRQVANDDDALLNKVSDVITSEKSPDQPISIANNEPDAASSESSIQTCRDTPGSVAALEVVTTYRNHQEMHDLVKDATCGSFSTSDPLKIEDLMTDVSVCLAGLPETARQNILTPTPTVLETLGKNNILETADLPFNDTEMVQPVNPVQNLVSEHDEKDPESNRTDTTLDKYATSESGQEVSQVANDDDALVNRVSDVIDSEKSHEQQLTANSETDKPSSEFLTQTCQDEPECVIIAEEAMTSYDTLPEIRDIADDLTCSLTLKHFHKADTLNIPTPASTLGKNNGSLQTSDVPVSECEMTQTVTVEAATTQKTHPVMHDIAKDLTCCDFITSEIPKIEEPKTSHPLSMADLHDADTPNILTHASTLLDSLGMNNYFLEAADVSVNNSEIIHTVNKDLASTSVEFYTSILTQTDPNILQDSSRTDDSTDGMIDTLVVSKEKPLPACSNDPSGTVIQSESIFSQSMPETNEKDLFQATPLPTPVTNEDLGNCSKEINDACSKFTGTERDVKGDSELWLDPRQFLAGEEDEGAIFDKWGHSCSPSPPTTHSDNTKASDYSRRENISIDHHTEDWELRFPPVERWSSSDSWASALSDWFQAVNTYPEDSSTGSKLGMAIQDNILEQRTSSDNANNAGQTCLSMNLLEPDKPNQALVRGLVESDNTNGTLFKQGDKDSDTTTTESHMNLLETSAKCECHKLDKNAVMDTFNASSVYEFNAKLYGCQHISGELSSAKSEGNVLAEVTGDKVSQLGLVFGEERQSSFSSPRSSAYTREKNLTGYVSDEERRHSSDVHLCICPSPSDSHVSSKAGRAEGNESFVQSNIGDCADNTPQFIMPFAPLCTGNTFIHHSFLKEDRSQPDLDLLPKRIINKTNRKSDQKSSSSDDSSEDHFHTCPDQPLSPSSGDSDDPSIKDTRRKPEYSDTCDISNKLSKLLLLTGERFMVSEDNRVAYVTLDLDDSSNFGCFPLSNSEEQSKPDNMPHKTSKTTSDGKMRSKHKEKPDDKHQNGIQASKKQDLQVKNEGAACEDPVTVIETIVITEKIIPKTQGKKKKKHAQHGAPKPENDGGQKNANGKAENLEAKVASNGLNKPPSHPSAKMDKKDSTQKVMSVKPKVDPNSVNATAIKLKVDTSNTAKTEDKTCTSDSLSTCLPSTLNDDIKRRRIAGDLSGAVPIRTRPQLPAIFRQARKDGEDVTRRAYSEVVKQSSTPKEAVVPRVVSEIQADPVPADPQNISLWCQFSLVPPDATVKWTKEGTVLSEINKVGKEDGRFTLTITKACSKDLGLYKCSLNAANISVSTSEYHLTSEVLMELVIPSHDQAAEPRDMDGDEENIQCSPLLFKEDFLSDQYFGENQPASILTEKVHFGEGMHRKAFRTTLTEGKLPRFRPGHPCVLKVHNAISYGTKNNDELVQKNYSLAVEECHVQNTAREYIKAYNSVAKSAESFGEVPEIIPIYLVHRPSNDIPYATLEEELLGDFVKYSVKDGKEINLMRRDSEAGQKCCAFQHWVYTQTEGNLLVTDMQGVGMKLTDVGIATCKKGYKGFRGNCATTFIDQFKALHQCNRFCELLGLTSLQPKPKRAVAPPKPKTQPVPKKKTFGPILNAKS